jgi:hypothetical protein
MYILVSNLAYQLALLKMGVAEGTLDVSSAYVLTLILLLYLMDNK